MTDDGSQDCYSNMTFKSHLSLEFGMAFISWQDWLFTIWALSLDSYVWICSISPWNITFSFPFSFSSLGELNYLDWYGIVEWKCHWDSRQRHFEPELYHLATEHAHQSFLPPLLLQSIAVKWDLQSFLPCILHALMRMKMSWDDVNILYKLL